MYRKSYCTTPDIIVGVYGSGSISKVLKFYVAVYYVIGKALSDELSCMHTGLVNRIVFISHNMIKMNI